MERDRPRLDPDRNLVHGRAARAPSARRAKSAHLCTLQYPNVAIVASVSLSACVSV